MGEYTALEILVVETQGPFLKAQRPHLVLWFQAIQVREDLSDAKVVTLARSSKGRGWEEHVRSVSRERVDEVLGLLSELGIPGRDLRVRGTLDTSDTSSKLLLRVHLNDREHTLNLDMLASGFEGEDAEALCSLLRKLQELSKVDFGCISVSSQLERWAGSA